MKTCNISKNIQHMKTIQWVVLVHNTRFNDSRSKGVRFLPKLCKNAYFLWG